MSLLSLPMTDLSIVIDAIKQQNSKESSEMLNNLFEKSVRDNYSADIVKLLLQCKQVDPSIPDNVAIRIMAQKGCTEVVDLLLKDIRVDPNAMNALGFDALMNACDKDHIEVVKLLLQDPRVNPKAGKNRAIRLASNNDHTEIVKLLIPKINLSEITDKKILDLVEKAPLKEIVKVASDEDLSIARELVPMLSVERAIDYHKWIEVGTILHNIDYRLLDAWIAFSKKVPSKFHNEECAKKWIRFGPTDRNMVALQLMASHDSPYEYKKWTASKYSLSPEKKNLLKEIVVEMKSLNIASIETTKATTVGISNLTITDKMRTLDIFKIQITGEKVILEFI